MIYIFSTFPPPKINKESMNNETKDIRSVYSWRFPNNDINTIALWIKYKRKHKHIRRQIKEVNLKTYPLNRTSSRQPYWNIFMLMNNDKSSSLYDVIYMNSTSCSKPMTIELCLNLIPWRVRRQLDFEFSLDPSLFRYLNAIQRVQLW